MSKKSLSAYPHPDPERSFSGPDAPVTEEDVVEENGKQGCTMILK
jgi:hypothetical protein